MLFSAAAQVRGGPPLQNNYRGRIGRHRPAWDERCRPALGSVPVPDRAHIVGVERVHADRDIVVGRVDHVAVADVDPDIVSARVIDLEKRSST